MRRLAAVYSMVERLRSVEARVAAGILADADGRCRSEQLACATEVERGRTALSCGDSAGWLIAEAERRATDTRLDRLLVHRAQCAADYQIAHEEYQSSRLQAEQVSRVVERTREMHEREEERRVQAESDDRYAGRLCWERNQRGQH